VKKSVLHSFVAQAALGLQGYLVIREVFALIRSFSGDVAQLSAEIFPIVAALIVLAALVFLGRRPDNNLNNSLGKRGQASNLDSE